MKTRRLLGVSLALVMVLLLSGCKAHLSDFTITVPNTMTTGETANVTVNYTFVETNADDAAKQETIQALQTTYSSSDSTIVSVDADGKLTAGKEGTATITVNVKDGDKTAAKTADIKVEAPVVFTVLPSSVNMEAGEATALKVTSISDEDKQQQITWSSSDEKVATVDSNGNVTGVAAGNAEITVTTASGASCQVKVTVSAQPTATPEPTATATPQKKTNGNKTSQPTPPAAPAVPDPPAPAAPAAPAEPTQAPAAPDTPVTDGQGQDPGTVIHDSPEVELTDPLGQGGEGEGGVG